MFKISKDKSSSREQDQPQSVQRVLSFRPGSLKNLFRKKPKSDPTVVETEAKADLDTNENEFDDLLFSFPTLGSDYCSTSTYITTRRTVRANKRNPSFWSPESSTSRDVIKSSTSYQICDEETKAPILDIPKMHASLPAGLLKLSDLFDHEAMLVESTHLLLQARVQRELPERLTLADFENVEYFSSGETCSIAQANWKEGETVALKIIREACCDSDEEVLDFLTEYQLLKRVDHPQIVRALGLGYLPSDKKHLHPQIFIVQELLSNGTLTEMMDEVSDSARDMPLLERTEMPFDKVLLIAQGVANALHYLHSQFLENATVIFRDLQPDNIMFDNNGEVRLIDLGLCTCIPRRTSSEQKYALSAFQEQLRYMAPEATGDEPFYNETVDIYAWALILWQMCSLSLPYGENLTDKNFAARVAGRQERPTIPTTWPQRLQFLLEKCWHQDPTQRPAWPEILQHVQLLMLNLEKEQPDVFVGEYTQLDSPSSSPNILCGLSHEDVCTCTLM